MNEENSFIHLRKLCSFCAMSTKPVRKLQKLEMKLNLHKMHHTTYKIAFCCGVLENRY